MADRSQIHVLGASHIIYKHSLGTPEYVLPYLCEFALTGDPDALQAEIYNDLTQGESGIDISPYEGLWLPTIEHLYIIHDGQIDVYAYPESHWLSAPHEAQPLEALNLVRSICPVSKPIGFIRRATGLERFGDWILSSLHYFGIQ